MRSVDVEMVHGNSGTITVSTVGYSRRYGERVDGHVWTMMSGGSRGRKLVQYSMLIRWTGTVEHE